MTLTEMKDAVDGIPSGDVTIESLSVTSNGTYRAPTGKAYTPVTVNVSAPSPTLQTKTKTYTPTTSQQTESVTADSGYDGLGQVNITVNAANLEDKTLNVSSPGYHAITPSDGYIGLSEADVIVPSMRDPQISTTPQGQSGGFISQTDTQRYFNLPSGFNSTARYYTISALDYREYPTELTDDQWGQHYVATITPSTSRKYLTLLGGYYQTSGQYTIPQLEDRSITFTPSESTQTQTISKSNQGFSGLNEVTVTVNPISTTYVGSGITRRASSDLTASGGTVTVPSGYYDASATKDIDLVPYAIRPDAELIQSYSFDQYAVADLGLTIPAYVTTAQSLRASTNLSPTITANLNDYRYIVAERFLTIPEYSVTTKGKGRQEYTWCNYIYEITRVNANEFATIIDPTKKITSAQTFWASNALYRLLYWSSSSAIALYATNAYGAYQTPTTPSLSSGGVLTVKSPVLGVRGSTTYFTSTYMNALTDIRYQYVIDVYRAPLNNLNVDGWEQDQNLQHIVDCINTTNHDLS